MNEKTESLSCKNCKYFINHSGAACMYAHGFKQVLLLLLLGPKPLFNTEICEHFDVGLPTPRKLCKYNSEYVTPSKHNQNGKCKCIECDEPCKHCFHMPMPINCVACRKYSAKVK